jgi:hypothetical protein
MATIKITAAERRRRIDAFRSIIVPHARIKDVRRRVVNLIDDTRAQIARNQETIARYGNGAQIDYLWILPIIGPSGATKSKTIGEVVKHVLDTQKLGENDVPILMATVRTSTKSPRFLQAQILEAYGDKSARIVMTSRDYSETAVNLDIREAARSRKTAIVVLDETHNMIIKNGLASTVAMAKAVKSLLNDGIFSIVCLGTEHMAQLFAADSELAGRMKDPIDFGKFEIGDPDDREYFFNFVGMLEDEMLRLRVIDKEIGLLDTVQRRACVYDFAGGVIGNVHRVIETALDRALEDKRGFIEIDDIARSIRAKNLATRLKNGNDGDDKVVYYDAFKKGPNPGTLAVLKEEEGDLANQAEVARSKQSGARR